MRRVSAAVLATTAVLVAGCGASAGDLMGIRVGGGFARVSERIRVTDDGRANCNGRPLKQISSQLVLDAREVERKLKKLAERGARYDVRRPDARQFRIDTNDGTVSWTEAAAGPPALARATLLALRLERRLCLR